MLVNCSQDCNISRINTQGNSTITFLILNTFDLKEMDWKRPKPNAQHDPLQSHLSYVHEVIWSMTCWWFLPATLFKKKWTSSGHRSTTCWHTDFVRDSISWKENIWLSDISNVNEPLNTIQYSTGVCLFSLIYNSLLYSYPIMNNHCISVLYSHPRYPPGTEWTWFPPPP